MLSNLDTKWYYGTKPDYTKADLHFLKTKTQNHAEDSLELIVENFTKSTETELFHKTDISQHVMSSPKHYWANTNGGPKYSLQDFADKGSYGCLFDVAELDGGFKDLSREEVDAKFFGAFEQFSWEVIKVYSPPPVIGFSWRHWGNFTGEYEGNQGKGELIQLFGLSVVELHDGKLGRFENFFEAKPFLDALSGIDDRLMKQKVEETGHRVLLNFFESNFATKFM